VTKPGTILVLAGTNGAGKSSVAGAALEQQGGTYYNPDRATQRYVRAGLSEEAANSRAWHRGREQLARAIRQGHDYAFETTLGGRTITRLLLHAAERGRRVRIWYVGLATPELHIQRVRERVNRGGHDIPEDRIRDRWTSSRENLVRLIPHTNELALYDNSAEAVPERGEKPVPQRLLWVREGAVVQIAAPAEIPVWAQPIMAAALKHWSP
jgi:predicted ABC-type ATPase